MNSPSEHADDDAEDSVQGSQQSASPTPFQTVTQDVCCTVQWSAQPARPTEYQPSPDLHSSRFPGPLPGTTHHVPPRTPQETSVTQPQTSIGIRRLAQPAASSSALGQIAEAEKFWRQSVREWYPGLFSQSYFVPPLHFNRVSYTVQTVASQFVLVPQAASDQPNQRPIYFPPTGPPPSSSDPPLASQVWPSYQLVPPGPLPVTYDMESREDHTLQVVREFVQQLVESKHEVMMVLTQLEFRKYLDNEVNPITAAAIRLLPRPATFGLSSGQTGAQGGDQGKTKTGKQTKQPNLRGGLQGDLDLLLINLLYGLIVGEIKSVGADPSKTPDLDQAVLKAVTKAVKQLEKNVAVLQYLVSDLAPIRVIKTLILPNITSTQLQRALSCNMQVQQALCQCLGVPASDAAAAVCRCLCADDISHPTVSLWWQRTVTDHGPDSTMTGYLYERLVARFCGPATTVEVPTVTAPRRTMELRTLSEAVALTGLTMSTLTLYPQQVDLVSRPDPLVFLWGPPGTGKTVVLILKGIQWWHQGKDIHLMSTHRDSRATTMLIERQLLRSVSSESAPHPCVHPHFFDFVRPRDVDAAVEELSSVAPDGELHVIADEAFCGRDETNGRFAEFCNRLASQVPALYLWAAGVRRDVTVRCMLEECLTTPVRCPPVVLREVERSWHIEDKHVLRYTGSPVPSPTDGPRIRTVYHRQPGNLNDLVSGHTWGWSEDCKGCGNAVADLLEELHVGQEGGVLSLQYRDVFVLCHRPSDNLAFVRVLCARRLPVRVVTSSDNKETILDLALAKRNVINVTHWRVVSGLERRVVVVLGCSKRDLNERLYSISRCTSCLVFVGDPVEKPERETQ